MRGATFDPLDLVVVPFPFTDRRTAKRRPALIVSSAAFNAGHHQSILAMITSARTQWQSDVAIQDWRQAGLNVPCKVRLKLFTLDDGMIVSKIGALTERDRRAVRNALTRCLTVGGGG